MHISSGLQFHFRGCILQIKYTGLNCEGAFVQLTHCMVRKEKITNNLDVPQQGIN